MIVPRIILTKPSSLKEMIHETTIEQDESDRGSNLSLDSKNGAVYTGPSWNYGTTSAIPRATGETISIPQPDVMQEYLYPLSDTLKKNILSNRTRVTDVLTQDISQKFTSPLLLIAGPSHVTDPNQVRACAKWLGIKSGKKFMNNDISINDNITNPPSSFTNPSSLTNPTTLLNNLLISLRANLTKNNQVYAELGETKAGISTMSFEIQHGIPLCRALLAELAEICPIVGETSASITPQYLADLFSLGLVSSTLVESQLHRELVSGTSYPIAFGTLDSHLAFDKDMYGHRIGSALDSMYASSQSHQFLSVTKVGTVAVVGTTGNEDTFVILQVNLELTVEDLKSLISKVYGYPHTNKNLPKIMLDVGRLDGNNYFEKLAILQQLLRADETKFKIVGVMIDSGDNYVTPGSSVDLTLDGVYVTELPDSLHYFKKNHIADDIEFLTKPRSTNLYEHLVYADNLMEELQILAGERIDCI